MNNLNVIIVQSFFAIIWILLKKVVYCLWGEDYKAFNYIKEYYYWTEYILLFTATVLTPKHTTDEGILTLIVVIIIKFILDRLTFIDNACKKYIRSNKSR